MLAGSSTTRSMLFGKWKLKLFGNRTASHSCPSKSRLNIHCDWRAAVLICHGPECLPPNIFPVSNRAIGGRSPGLHSTKHHFVSQCSCMSCAHIINLSTKVEHLMSSWSLKVNLCPSCTVLEATLRQYCAYGLP